MHIDWIIPFYVAICAVPAFGVLICCWVIARRVGHLTSRVWGGLTHGSSRRA
jgi:hypothetical protein